MAASHEAVGAEVVTVDNSLPAAGSPLPTDFSPFVAKLLEKSPTVVLLVISFDQVEPVAKGLRDAGFQGVIEQFVFETDLLAYVAPNYSGVDGSYVAATAIGSPKGDGKGGRQRGRGWDPDQGGHRLQRRLPHRQAEVTGGRPDGEDDVAGRLDGRVALVTGAGNGIGRACALALGAEGARVVVNDLGTDEFARGTSAGPADATVATIVEGGGTAVANHDSVADPAGCGRAVQQAVDAFGQLDIVVGCAGAIIDGSLAADDATLRALPRPVPVAEVLVGPGRAAGHGGTGLGPAGHHDLARGDRSARPADLRRRHGRGGVADQGAGPRVPAVRRDGQLPGAGVRRPVSTR